MTFPSFHDSPSIELLQWLARGSLKQNLLRSLRLWVWLRFFYDADAFKLPFSHRLPDPFTYANWRDAFFRDPSAHFSESIPKAHDLRCRCAKTTAAWLFQPDLSQNQLQWEAFCKKYPNQVLDSKRQFLEALEQHDSVPANLETLLEMPLFRVTRRTLYDDLQILVNLEWVKRRGYEYYHCSQFPTRPLSRNQETFSPVLSFNELNFLPPDLAAIATQHAQIINNSQRFFLHVDYVVPPVTLDKIDDFSNQLREIWQQVPVPPIELVYRSAATRQTVRCIVYPICIYYVSRAVYLCGLGQTPADDLPLCGYNFRLDKIEEIREKTWSDPQVPVELIQAFKTASLPTPDLIQEEISRVWGFDFYQPVQTLLVRFERDFHDRYIKGTFRHETFEPVSLDIAQRLIYQQVKDPESRQRLLDTIKTHKIDAYYTAKYRKNDPNVKIRLRGWRPKIEILLPLELRRQIATDVAKEWGFYHGSF